MRMLFIGDKLEPSSGSAHKVVAMATEWERRGHSVWLTTARAPTPRRVSDVAPRLRMPPPPARSLPERIVGEASVRWFYPVALQRWCRRLGIDLIYSRGLPPAPGLRALMAGVPFVLEINGDVGMEIASPVRRRAKLRSRALQLANADGVVFISRELSRACKPEPRCWTVIANPCLPSAVGPVPERPNRPRLVLIGYTKHDWSGIDKMPELARALPDLDFVVIGAELSGPPNLRCFPVLPQDEADRVMRGCTVGIGPIALYRKGMHEASPLKSRNYLALGLPIIQAGEDTDLTADDGCLLELPNTEDSLTNNLERIQEFAWRAFRDPSLSQRALALAQGRLSLQAKESERLAFIARCLDASRARPV
jgi:hypothetical protein